ncbi:NAD(P)/FAD-dependent oxidoreductase [Kosmotoga pacifica]|uniref:Flavoprotein n=1 Tax=Kosmotoga pacifica TaxID=1330330 RepID=A0A0G2ZE54_9BACT|nr:NAD(P)/FAD-dependent oxidoreductase [Kosmotoga pacifica]AKI97839.1 hypothetical protein IX53_08485 [Kosmotoga pacifica]
MVVYDVIVIGAGPAGLFTAINTANCGMKVIILEKKKSPAKKLLISGSGQCNLTHTGSITDFLSHYGDNGRFVKPALYAFDNRRLIKYFKDRGLDTIIKEEGKVFPSTMKAEDVLNVLLLDAKKKSVTLKCETPVVDVKRLGNGFNVITREKLYNSKSLVIATGGKSYPWTGSEGDGYRFAAKFGHNIIKPEPALVPFYIKNFQLQELSGISFEGARVAIWRDGKKISERKEPLLITHRGFSGPSILHLSRIAVTGDEISVNFLDITHEEFERNLMAQGNILVRTRLRKLGYPVRLLDKLMQDCGLSLNLKISQLNKIARKKLVRIFTDYRTVIEKGGFNIAMVTKGGVDLKEINPKTMESKKVKGLYFVGEVLNIDGDTGGYNLQAAFSSAYLAAKSLCG